MPHLVAIEITDWDCQSRLARASSPDKVEPLSPVLLRPPELEARGRYYRVKSVHTRLDPRDTRTGRELYDAFEATYTEARARVGEGEPLVAVVGIPGAYSVTQKELLRNLVLNSGFAGTGLLGVSVAAALGCAGEDAHTTTVLSVCADTGGFMASVVDASGAVSRERSLEVSSSCGISAFLQAACNAILANASEQPIAQMFERSVVLRETIDRLLEKDGLFEDVEVEVGDGQGVLAVSGESLSTYLGPVFEEFKNHTSAAMETFDPELIYVSPVLHKWPIVMGYLQSRLPGIPIVSDPEAVLNGSLRYGRLSPPEIQKNPPEKIEFDTPAPGTVSGVLAEIDCLKNQLEDLEQEMARVRLKLASNYDSAAQTYFAQRQYDQAWEMSRMAVEKDGASARIRSRHRQVSLWLVQEWGAKHRISEMDILLKQIRQTCGSQVYQQAKEIRDYYLADHLARCSRDTGGAKRILTKLCARNPKFSEARQLLNLLSGR